MHTPCITFNPSQDAENEPSARSDEEGSLTTPTKATGRTDWEDTQIHSVSPHLIDRGDQQHSAPKDGLGLRVYLFDLEQREASCDQALSLNRA